MMVVALELLCLSWPCTFSSKFQFCTSTTILKIGIHFFPNRCPTIWYLSYYFHLYFRTEICKPCKSIQSSFLLARALARVRTPSCARAFERAPIRPEVVKPEASRSRPDLLHSHLGHYPRNGFDCRISQRQQQQQKSVGIKLFCIFWRQRTKISARFSELPESTLPKSYQKIKLS